MLFLLACLSKPILSTPTWNRSAEIRLEDSADVPDFSQPGSYDFARSTGKEKVHETCMMRYAFYQTEKSDSVLVILSHGFARNTGHMRKWAEHLASWGFTVLTPQHCHLNPSDVNPSLAAQELLTLSQKLDFRRVIYAGQSNGGAISIIAGAQDPKAIAVVGFDTTESYKKPTGEYAKSISIPVYGLLGEPSGCNAQGNGRSLYKDIAEVYTYRLKTSDHCDFESPSGGLC
ncbi:MAG: alpha/beta hydrolase [Myxococcota bacterium]|nr:alpha/beta hydrolase [Myxococcota bacterium]